MNERIRNKVTQWMGGPNEKNIIRYLLLNPKSSRTDISKALNISMSTVTNVTEKLIQKALVRECGLQKIARGRSSILLEPNASKYKSIGVGISSSRISVELIDLSGVKYDQQELILDETSWDQNFENITAAIKEILNNNTQIVNDILGIGIATPGFVEYRMKNLDRKYLIDEWQPDNIISMLEENFELGVTISSAATSALSGESYFGNGSSYNKVVYVNVSSGGIGWAKIENKIIDKRVDKHSRAMGHTSIDLNGPQCPCSQHGCLELYTCKEALVDNYKRILSLETNSMLSVKYSGDLDQLNYHHILNYADKGDIVAVQSISKSATILGLALGNIGSLLHPDLIILSGKIIEESQIYFEITKKVANSKLQAVLGKPFSIEQPQMLSMAKREKDNRIINNSLAVGAATLVFESIFLGK